MERRSVLILAVPAGLVLGAAVWLAAGAGDGRAVAATQSRLDALPRLRRPTAGAVGGIGAQALMARPLFDQRDPVRELAVRLEGIARSPGRTAALLSINGAPAQWVNLGETVGGVTLETLSASVATLDTPSGSREVALGASLGPAMAIASAAPTAAPAPALAGMEGGPPPGFRSPPPPASAPGGAP